MPSNSLKQYRLTFGDHSPKSLPSIWLEIRLFYVRIGPCAVDEAPEFLTLRHLRDEFGVPMEINGSRVSPSETVSSTLRRDRVDRESEEVTYVSTDGVKIAGSVSFEVYEEEELILCGSLERIKSDWTIECYPASPSSRGGTSVFFRPKLGISSQTIEVYVAGRCSDVPVILTKMINISSRRKHHRYCPLEAIPEVDDEVEKEERIGNDLIWSQKLQLAENEVDYESEKKFAHNWYGEDIYEGEDGQLSWFNAGVRVGVGIGLGMCLGVGIGVGIIMRSYQTTSRTFRRRFI